MGLMETKLEEMKAKQEELCKFYAGILENLGDEGSTVLHQSGVALYLPTEKLNYLIKELEAMRTEYERMAIIEEFICEVKP